MTIISKTARFDNARALTNEEMYKLAPSIFAIDKHESRSQKFRPIPTIEILDKLKIEGFVPVGVRQSRSRDENKNNFTKHLVRLRRIDESIKYAVGDTICEILLKNANDGTSAYELMAGLFKITCLNSMVSKIGELDSIKIKHFGKMADDIIEGTYTVLNSAENNLETAIQWSQLKLSAPKKLQFAEAVKEFRFRNYKVQDLNPIDLISPRREEDTGDDLWSVFNCAQENIIRGGINFRIKNPETNKIRYNTTREVKNIEQDLKLNKQLWALAEQTALAA